LGCTVLFGIFFILKRNVVNEYRLLAFRSSEGLNTGSTQWESSDILSPFYSCTCTGWPKKSKHADIKQRPHTYIFKKLFGCVHIRCLELLVILNCCSDRHTWYILLLDKKISRVHLHPSTESMVVQNSKFSYWHLAVCLRMPDP
jgi:hypothetical protein